MPLVSDDERMVLMMVMPALLTGSALRVRLETAFGEGAMEEAFRISALLDEIQMDLFQQDLAYERTAV